MQTFRYVAATEQMYHHQHQQQFQSHSQHLSSRSSLPREKQFLLQGGGDSGLVLSTDAKPRLKWTNELHERFVDAVNQLGGPDKATPKTIMRLMGIPGLTLYHLKSHLQKYRLSKNLQAQSNSVHARNVSVPSCTSATDRSCEGNGSTASQINLEAQTSKSVHINETLQMQIEVQRRLHEQIEVQRHLQLRIEAQGKYLQSVLEKAQEALQKQGLAVASGDTVGLPAAAASMRSDHHLVFSTTALAATRLHEAGDERTGGMQRRRGGSSVDSCLTAGGECSGSHRDGDHDDGMLSISLSAAHTHRSSGCEAAGEYCMFLHKPSASRRSPSSSSSSGEHREWRRGIVGDDGFSSSISMKLQPTTTAELDLNIDGKIDLNGSGWN